MEVGDRPSLGRLSDLVKLEAVQVGGRHRADLHLLERVLTVIDVG